MASIKKAFNQAYADMKRKGWDWIYIYVDLHSTVIKPTYVHDDISINYYPLAKEALQMLSNRPDIRLVMYTCQNDKTCTRQAQQFKLDDIHFDGINVNLETDPSEYADYSFKPYFNVLLEDKAGFEPEEDWKRIIDFYEVFS